MRREWEPEDLIAAWMLLEDERAMLRNKSGANRLGFAAYTTAQEKAAPRPHHPGRGVGRRGHHHAG